MLNALSALLLALFGIFFFRSLIGGKTDYRAKMEEAKRKAAEHKQNTRDPDPARQRSRENEAAEDMTQCAICETWVPANTASNCGREGCPY